MMGPRLTALLARWRRRKPHASESAPRSHPAAQALLAGLMQGIGEREGDEILKEEGRKLGETAIAALPARPHVDAHLRRIEGWKDAQARRGWPTTDADRAPKVLPLYVGFSAAPHPRQQGTAKVIRLPVRRLDP